MKKLIQIATIDTENPIYTKKIMQLFDNSNLIVAEVADYNTRIIVMEEQEENE